MAKTRQAARAKVKETVSKKASAKFSNGEKVKLTYSEHDSKEQRGGRENNSLKTRAQGKVISKSKTKHGATKVKKVAKSKVNAVQKELVLEKRIKRGGDKKALKEVEIQKLEAHPDFEDTDTNVVNAELKAEVPDEKKATEAIQDDVKNEDGVPKKVGLHVSASGGLHNAVQNALEVGACAFGLFLRNQRQWAAKPLKDEDVAKFKQALAESGYSPSNVLPHGIYLMNCASPDDSTLSKSREALADELRRCERLGLALYNFHPGSTCGKISVEEGIERIAESINEAHKETKHVATLIENMCCQGHTIGGKFEELRAIIDKIEDKSRMGVCFDTCHAFAAGYDISSKETLDHTMEMFDKVVGLEYLKAVHLNDSKGNCGCSLDRHENIGQGKIGIRGFKAVMNDKRFNNIPMILETPECDYSKEISKLYSLVSK